MEAGLDQLVVSIDGASAEAFGRVRSGASLEHVVENVRRLHDRRGPNYGPGMRIGVEFVAMRSNVAELPGLGRLAARLGATFIIVSNVLAYTPELLDETLYDHRASSLSRAETTAAPRWRLPAFDWDGQLGAALGEALSHAGPVSFFGADPEATRSHCPFVEGDACAVAWQAASALARRCCTRTPASCAGARNGWCAGRQAAFRRRALGVHLDEARR